MGSSTAFLAGAGELRLEPVSLALRPGEAATTLWLDNAGPESLRAQARVFSWTQDGGGEVLVATRELAVSPPMIEVPPHGRQLIRVVKRGDSIPPAEAAYRLIVDELPGGPATPGHRMAGLLRYSIPVFLLPQMPASGYRLEARIEQDPGGSRRLSLENHGDRHARIAGLTVVDRDGRRHRLASGLAGYVLPGRYKHWQLPGSFPPVLDGYIEANVNGRQEKIPAPAEGR